MVDLPPALLQRLEVQAKRQHCTTTELLTGWLAQAEADSAADASMVSEQDHVFDQVGAAPLPRAAGSNDPAPGTAEREQMNAALIQSERRLRIISEMTSDYAYSFKVLPTLALQLEWVTVHAFQRITEYTPEEVAQNGGWSSLLHPDDRDETKQTVARFMTTAMTLEFDYRIVTKSGAIRHLLAVNKSVADDRGRICRVYGTVKDITERRRYEAALRDSEQRYRMLADNVIDTIVSVDDQNLVAYISPSVERLLGYSPEAFLGRSPIDWVDPAQLDELFSRWKDLQAQGSGFQRSEYRMRHKAGHYVWIETISRLNTSPAVSVWRNIDERKKAEQSQQEAEKRFSAVFYNSPISISLRPLKQGQFVEVNDAFARLFGYSREEVLGGLVQSPDLWIDADERAEFSRIRAENNQVVQFEHHLRKKSGELSTALISSVVADINGEPYSITFGQDIAEWKKAEQLKQEAESRFTAVFHNSPIGITLRNRASGQILAVNDAFVQLLGYSRDELMNGQFQMTDVWSSPEDRAAYRRERETHNPIRQAEHRLRKKSGELVSVLMSSIVIEINGDPVSITFTQNISELKEAEQIQRERDQLRVALEKEHEINQIANRVIRTISHEFRTPLATIRSAAFTLGRMSGDLSDAANHDKREKRLQVIDNQVTVLDHLIDDISLLIRNLSGQVPFEPAEIQLDLLCRASIEEMQATLGTRHTLLFETTGEIHEFVADKKLLERVLINLLSNAIKYSAPGTTIWLTLSQERDQAVIRIIDQGWGIAPADLGLLFTPYFRADEAQGVSGVGLGLSIVRECVERHQGRITVESKLDEGTTFTVYLPIVSGDRVEKTEGKAAD